MQRFLPLHCRSEKERKFNASLPQLQWVKPSGVRGERAEATHLSVWAVEGRRWVGLSVYTKTRRARLSCSELPVFSPRLPITHTHCTMASRQFVRSLATASAAAVKPPVQLYGLDGTYATALFTAAVKDSSVDKAFASVEKLQNAIKEDPKLGSILANPSLSFSSRKQVLSTVDSALKLDPIVQNLLEVLSENNRLELFSAIAKQFSILHSAYNGVIEATVVSAKPLDSRTISRLHKAIAGSKFVGSGKTLKITNQVDPQILGGLIVEVGGNSVDLSVSAKVSKLNKVLTESI